MQAIPPATHEKVGEVTAAVEALLPSVSKTVSAHTEVLQ